MDGSFSARTPRQRWEAAVSVRPLEAPRPLPSAFHALARALTGRGHPPSYTTGPATRHALAATGALGATTGTVVHLPAPPGHAPASAAVLAHELAHTRNPVRRPRFLLGLGSGLLDDDERQALAAGAGRRLADAAGAAAGAGHGLGAAGAGHGLGAAAGAGAPVAAGIVEQLPVGGGIGAIGDVATRAARAAVLEATAGPMGRMSGLASGAAATAERAADGLPAGFGAAAAGLPGAAVSGLGLPDGAPPGPGALPGVDLPGAARAAAGGLSGADLSGFGGTGAGGGAAPGGAASPGSTAAAGPSTPAAAAIDPDRVVEIVEARLLREIERRGGRWAGVF